VASERCSVEEQWMGVWHGACTMPLDTTRPSTAPQLSISQKALGMLPEDGNVMPKHVGATIHN
jgi:hypothetical protein